jgi:hypothetical protein
LTATKPRIYADAGTVDVIKGFSSADDDLLKTLAAKYGIAMALDNLNLLVRPLQAYYFYDYTRECRD